MFGRETFPWYADFKCIVASRTVPMSVCTRLVTPRTVAMSVHPSHAVSSYLPPSMSWASGGGVAVWALPCAGSHASRCQINAE